MIMHILRLILQLELTIFGIVYFIRGFLFQKSILENVSEPVDDNITSHWDHVVVLVIDALKYDFISGDGGLQLKIVSDLEKRYPARSALYKFIADPPTTTLQRLKGLTTGTLPTFVEVGSNFGGSAILEDNIIDQLRAKHQNSVFVGDDTWESIYPGKFLRSYAYPSFDVWDLDTVDRGVENHLPEELKKTDWKLLIAHCLGIDHAGHRYGPNHPEMVRKLQETDELISLIIDRLPQNTLLLVFGDHGMTSTGDHGGDTHDEVNAGLFAFSNGHAFPADDRSAVPQVDLVPTLSAILGIPIPFSNIGRVIKGLLPTGPYNENIYATVLMRNVRQVKTYIDLYITEVPTGLPSAQLEDLSNLYTNIDPKCNHPECLRTAEEFLAKVQQHFRQSWTQFNVFYMILGIIFTLVSFTGIFFAPSVEKLKNLVGALTLLNFCMVIIAHLEVLPVILEISLILLLSGVAILVITKSSRLVLQSGTPGLGFIFITSLVFFSNSFVVEEPAIMRYCLASFILYTKLRESDNFSNLGAGALACLFVQFNQYFEPCREENGPECKNNDVFKPLSSATNYNAAILLRICLAFVSLATLSQLTKPRSVIAKRFRVFSIACLGLNWTSECLGILPSSVQNFIPNLTYFTFFVILVLTVCRTSSLGDIIYFLMLVIMILIGDGVAPSVVSMALVSILWRKGRRTSDNSAAFFILLMWHGFFSGRNATFSSIQWNAAFVGSSVQLGSDKTKSWLFGYLMPMLKVGTATFGSHVLSGLMIVLWSSPEENLHFVSLSSLRLSFSMMACLILRRHLMTWKIFAPRFIFEGLGFLVSTFACVVGILLKANQCGFFSLQRKRKLENIGSLASHDS